MDLRRGIGALALVVAGCTTSSAGPDAGDASASASATRNGPESLGADSGDATPDAVDAPDNASSHVIEAGSACLVRADCPAPLGCVFAPDAGCDAIGWCDWLDKNPDGAACVGQYTCGCDGKAVALVKCNGGPAEATGPVAPFWVAAADAAQPAQVADPFCIVLDGGPADAAPAGEATDGAAASD